MRAAVLLIVVFSVSLPAPFGDAEAAALAVNDDGSAVLEVTVEVSGTPAAVLVRGVGLVDELPPVALAPRGDGTYGGLVELPTTVGVLLGFEYIPPGGAAATLTDLYTLVELGVDPAALAGVSPGPEPTTNSPATTEAAAPQSSGESVWGWMALAAGLAFLGLLGLWVWMGRREAVDKLSANADNSENADKTDDSELGSGAGSGIR